MARDRGHVCPEPGCPNPTPCPTHGKHRGGETPRDKGPYNDPRWRRLRLWHLHRHPVCVRCGATTRLAVDHIVPLSEGGRLLDSTNLQTLCWACHNRKTAEDRTHPT